MRRRLSRARATKARRGRSRGETIRGSRLRGRWLQDVQHRAAYVWKRGVAFYTARAEASDVRSFGGWGDHLASRLRSPGLASARDTSDAVSFSMYYPNFLTPCGSIPSPLSGEGGSPRSLLREHGFVAQGSSPRMHAHLKRGCTLQGLMPHEMQAGET